MTSTILITFGQILSGNTQNQELRPQGLDLGGSTASNQDPEALFPNLEDYDVKICLKFSVTVDRNNFLVYHKTFLLSFSHGSCFFDTFMEPASTYQSYQNWRTTSSLWPGTQLFDALSLYPGYGLLWVFV